MTNLHFLQIWRYIVPGKRQEMREKNKEKLKRRKDLNNTLIGVYRYWMNKSAPLSEVWCDCYNALQYQLYVHEVLNGKEVAD